MPKKTVIQIVAEKTRQFRNFKEMTQAGLALKAGVNIETVKRMENASGNVQLKNLDAVAKALGKEAWELIS